MHDDPEYRQHVRRFMWRLIWVTILLNIAAFSLSVLSALNLAWLGVLSVGYITYTVLASFRLQEFLNEKVGKALQ
jgi:hypothetical protein